MVSLIMNSNTNVNNFDKILTFIVGLGIIIYLIIKLYPSIINDYKTAKKDLENIKGEYYSTQVLNYINSHSDYYFNYEGAVYCIPVLNLINEGYITENNVGDNKDSLIEANYQDGKYYFEYNNDCKEK